jgi:hypothetical protein
VLPGKDDADSGNGPYQSYERVQEPDEDIQCGCERWGTGVPGEDSDR